MITMATPIIAEADYLVFRKVLPSLPPTFQEWQQELNLGISPSPSVTVVGIPVMATEFHIACEEGRAERSIHGLRNYASDIGLKIG